MSLVFALLLMAQPPLEAKPPPRPPSQAEAPPEPKWSSRSRLIALMEDADTFEVMRRHVPHIIAQIEGSTGIQVPLDFTLEDFLHVPESQITRKLLDQVDRELAAIR